MMPIRIASHGCTPLVVFVAVPPPVVVPPDVLPLGLTLKENEPTAGSPSSAETVFQRTT